MRLENYLTEQSFPQGLWDKIEKDCAPFLKELRSINNRNGFLYRGTNNAITQARIEQVRKDRMPKDTAEIVHTYADTVTKKRYGAKLRSQGLYTTTASYDTEGYGQNRVLVFPIGRYKYFWSPGIKDSYKLVGHAPIVRTMANLDQELQDKGYSFAGELESALQGDYFEKDYPQYVDLLYRAIDHNYAKVRYKHTGLKKAFQDDIEVIVMCDKYWAVHEDYENYVSDYVYGSDDF